MGLPCLTFSLGKEAYGDKAPCSLHQGRSACVRGDLPLSEFMMAIAEAVIVSFFAVELSLSSTKIRPQMGKGEI